MWQGERRSWRSFPHADHHRILPTGSTQLMMTRPSFGSLQRNRNNPVARFLAKEKFSVATRSSKFRFIASPRQSYSLPRVRLLLQQQCRSKSTKETADDAQAAAYAHYAKRIRPRRAQGSQSERNTNTAWYLLAIAIGALGASYASVPLYKVFCQTTGFGGTTQRVWIDDGSATTTTATLERWIQRNVLGPLAGSRGPRVHTWTDEDAAERLRQLKPVPNAELITVRFDTTVDSDTMQWSFEPVQLDVKLVPGETALSFFRVTNHSKKAITGVATYNVHPPKAGLYFQKIQCFCFEEQRLLPGETVDMPVFFFVDPEILEDPQISYVKSITLSYTFFKTDEDDDED